MELRTEFYLCNRARQLPLACAARTLCHRRGELNRFRPNDCDKPKTRRPRSGKRFMPIRLCWSALAALCLSGVTGFAAAEPEVTIEAAPERPIIELRGPSKAVTFDMI